MYLFCFCGYYFASRNFISFIYLFAQIAAGKIILSRSILVATLHSTLPATALCFRDVFVDGIWWLSNHNTYACHLVEGGGL